MAKIILEVPTGRTGVEALGILIKDVVDYCAIKNCPICKMVKQATLVPDNHITIEVTMQNASGLFAIMFLEEYGR